MQARSLFLISIILFFFQNLARNMRSFLVHHAEEAKRYVWPLSRTLISFGLEQRNEPRKCLWVQSRMWWANPLKILKSTILWLYNLVLPKHLDITFIGYRLNMSTQFLTQFSENGSTFKRLGSSLSPVIQRLWRRFYSFLLECREDELPFTLTTYFKQRKFQSIMCTILLFWNMKNSAPVFATTMNLFNDGKWINLRW